MFLTTWRHTRPPATKTLFSRIAATEYLSRPEPHMSSTITTLLTLLLRHTHSPPPPPRSLRMLPSNPQTPIMTQSTMGANLLQPLQVLAQFTFHPVGQYLRVLAIYNVSLTIEEPCWDFVLGRIIDDGYDPFEFFGCYFSRSEYIHT